MIKGVNNIKELIEEHKFNSGADVEEVSKCGEKIEQQIEFTDEQVLKITTQIRDMNNRIT